MNNLIIVGSMFIYIRVILGGLDSNQIPMEMTVATVCQVILIQHVQIDPYTACHTQKHTSGVTLCQGARGCPGPKVE